MLQIGQVFHDTAANFRSKFLGIRLNGIVIQRHALARLLSVKNSCMLIDLSHFTNCPHLALFSILSHFLAFAQDLSTLFIFNSTLSCGANEKALKDQL